MLRGGMQVLNHVPPEIADAQQDGLESLEIGGRGAIRVCPGVHGHGGPPCCLQWPSYLRMEEGDTERYNLHPVGVDEGKLYVRNC